MTCLVSYYVLEETMLYRLVISLLYLYELEPSMSNFVVMRPTLRESGDIRVAFYNYLAFYDSAAEA